MTEYLNEKMLNDIENKIEKLHKKYVEKFNQKETTLRNIKIGDILSNKTLYLTFPWESYQYIENNIGEFDAFIIIEPEKFICQKVSASGNQYIGYKYKNSFNFLYYKFLSEYNNRYNYIRYKMPDDYGKVLRIDSQNRFYNYIKILDDCTKLLEYNKKTWVINEIPYLQYIDHIEKGIENVANQFYMPAGYEQKEWTTTGYYNIEKSDYGLSQKPISIKDFERWNKNIKLLEEAFASFCNVWNVVSYIEWNSNSYFEWEEY